MEGDLQSKNGARRMSLEATTQIVAIDVHAHYGTYHRDGNSDLTNGFVSGSAAEVVRRAKAVNVGTTIASPLLALLPRGKADTCQGNRDAAEVVSETHGLLQWVVINPLQPDSYQQAAEMLQSPKCVGIKLHPEEHVYPITEHGDALFDFAAQHDAVVLVHSGDPYSWPADFIPFANRHSNITLLLAHLGNGGGATGDPELQVRAIQQSKHENVIVDTSSARSLAPGLLEWAVREVGADRILFGTDTPLYHTAMQHTRIVHADIDDEAKRLILRGNAERVWSPELFEGNSTC